MPPRIERKVPKAGEVFEGTFAKKKYRLKVIQLSDGIAYELDRCIFKTPTAAAKSITKFEVNGWRFWHMKRE